MKAFVWNSDFMRDWSSGIAVAVADDVMQAREILAAELNNRAQGDYVKDIECEPDEVIELDGPKVIAIESGGS